MCLLQNLLLIELQTTIAQNYVRRLTGITVFAGIDFVRQLLDKVRLYLELQESNGGKYRTIAKVVRFAEAAWWRVRGYRIIECFGDSHAAIFRHINSCCRSHKERFRVTSIRGATVHGMGNPNSKTNAMRIFTDQLSHIPTTQTVLFIMGEVDIGFLIWLKAQERQSQPESHLEEAFDRYSEFLDGVLVNHRHLIVTAAPLPTIPDGVVHGDVANARSVIKASQKERTMATLRFNGKVRNWASKRNVLFIDLDAVCLDPQTQMVKSLLINKNSSDHHYDTDAFVAIMYTELRKCKVIE